jgi:hypothetical protein
VRATDLAPVRLMQSDKDSLSFAFDFFAKSFCSAHKKRKKKVRKHLTVLTEINHLLSR